MKLLFTLLLCLLLAGCTAQKEVPTDGAIPVFTETENLLEQQYGSDVEAAFLPVPQADQFLPADDGFLLRSGSTLMILNEALQITASRTLDFEPLAAVRSDTVSVFDAGSRQFSLMDLSLQEMQCLTLPANLSGVPVCADNTLYYCTDNGIYRWDLVSGIRRRIRESAYEKQTLVDIHTNPAVLQYRILENGQEKDLFVDCESGRLLHTLAAPAKLTTFQGRYYCVFSSGSVENLVFGKDAEMPMGLFTGFHSGRGIFLAESHNGLILEKNQLSCYDLETGLPVDTLSLHHPPETILEHNGRILLLIREGSHSVLLHWQPGSTTTEGPVHTGPWFTSDAPDHAGLSQCREYAEQLSEQYGLDVRIWKDAAAVSPWDYTFTPEYRYPVLLNQLQTLEQGLSRYPKELLSQTAAHFDALKICLVQSVTGTAGSGSLVTATGVQFLNDKDAHVVIAAGPYQEQALYHELFHVMETHILSCSNALDRWNELNPAGFSYDLDHTANAQRNSGVYLENGTRAFVDTYSMSFPKEDRARIFEYAMLEDSAHLFRSDTMQRKLSAICSGIREAYNLENRDGPFPWEQYLH